MVRYLFSYISVVQDEVACDFFEFVDPEYTPRSMQVIDDLVEENIQDRDAFRTDRNHRYWAAQEEVRVEQGLHVEVRKVTNMFHVCLAVIGVLVGIIVFSWIG